MLEKINFDKFEPILAKFISSDINVLASVAPFIKKSQFKDENIGFFINCYIAFYKKAKKLINKEQLSLYFSNKAEESIIKDVFEKLELIDIKKYDQELLLKDTERFIKEREIWNTLIDIAKKLDTNTISSDEVLKKVEKVCNISLDEEEGYLDLFQDIDKVLAAIKEKKSVLSTGYPTLDRFIDGGLYKEGKALYMFMAPPNKGKSLLLGNIASNLAEMGKTVLLISLEMSEVAYASRFCSQLCAIPFAELHLHSEKVKPIFERQTGKIIIKEFPTGQKTVEQLKLWIKKNIYDKGIKVDAILIDYINLIANEADTLYEKIKVITEKVRAMSYFFKTPIVSVTQQNRTADGKSMAGLNSVGESMGISHTADFIGEIFFNEEDKVLNIMRVGIAKNRYGQVGVSFALKTNYETLRITDMEEECNYTSSAVIEIGESLDLFSN